jgi:hypothetical protein
MEMQRKGIFASKINLSIETAPICQSHIATDGQSVSMSWCQAQIWDI